MSTYEFQKALIQLSKNSVLVNSQDKKEFLKQYDLNQKEYLQLDKLISSKYVNNFSDRGLQKRFAKNVKFVFKTILSILGEDFIYHIYKDDFEPSCLYNNNNFTPKHFKEFLEQHSKVKSLNIDLNVLSQLMDYEWNLHFVFNGFIDDSWNPKHNSVLIKNSPIELCSFSFSVPELIENIENTNWEQAYTEIEYRDCHYLITRYINDGEEELGEFEIDHETFVFLKDQKTNPEVITELPASYNDLVDLGICKKPTH